MLGLEHARSRAIRSRAMSVHWATVTTTVPVDGARVYRALLSSVEQAAMTGGSASVAADSVTWDGGRLGHLHAAITGREKDAWIHLEVARMPWLDGWSLGPQVTPSQLELSVASNGDGRALVTIRQSAATTRQAQTLEFEWRRFYLAHLQGYFERVARAAGDIALQLSPYAAFRFSGETACVLSGAGGRFFDVPRAAATWLVDVFETARKRAEVLATVPAASRALFEETLDAFVGAAVLGTPAEIEPMPSSTRWEPHDLLYRQISSGSAPNQSWHELGRSEPLPAVKPSMSNEIVELKDAIDMGEVPLTTALAERRSTREFDVTPIPLDQIASFLAASARNARGDSAKRWNHVWMPGSYVARPYPSGGARYSLEIYLVVAKGRVEGLREGVFHYCPNRHVLERVSEGGEAADATLAGVTSESFIMPPEGVSRANTLPPVLVIVTSRIGRITFKYGGVAYDLMLKEVGALLQTFYLVGTASGLGGCALGGCRGAQALMRPLADPLEEPVVGYYMLGRPFPASAAGGPR